jgi:hypothetical protein
MKNYRVLENDIDINEIFTLAQQAGFTELSCKPMCRDGLLSLADYNALIETDNDPHVKEIISADAQNVMKRKTIFFLYKGIAIKDSRGSIGLSHTMRTDKNQYTVNTQEDLSISFELTNTGGSVWLCRNTSDLGVVKLGAHLYDETQTLIDLDFFRKTLVENIGPGEKISLTATLTFAHSGQYTLVFDLVSEGVCWFEHMGSQPVSVEVCVR